MGGVRTSRRGARKPSGGARLGALQLLDRVLDDGAFLSAAADNPESPLRGLSPGETARAQRLAAETLRNWARAGAGLDPFLRKKPPARIDRILRLAVVEICAHGEATHGVVASAVDLTRRDRRSGHYAGLVNAVLRKAAKDLPERWPTLPAPQLPGWLRRPLVAAYGKASVKAMEAVHAASPPLDLTPRDGDAAALAGQVEGEVLPTGSVRMARRVQVSALPGYETGAFWVQDAAAALPAQILAPRPGERVLDLCAAPGGKTLQLAASGAEVTALDLSEGRLKRLRANLNRTGLNAEIVAADALSWKGGPFDAVLLDAPCSASGTIRRHPDLPFVKDAASLEDLCTLQAAMIDRAVAFLRPGGQLVYCTCSLLPEEGEAQAVAALERHAHLRADPGVLDRPGVEAHWRGPHGLRLRPDFWAERGGMDGFFVAAFCLDPQ